jgi:FG-GAP repeat/FG-GAP-like repeat
MRRFTWFVLCALAITAPLSAEGFAEADVRVIWQKTGEAPGDQFGWVTDPVPDVDGDGIPEMMATSPTSSGNRGRVYVYSGDRGRLLFTVEGDPASQLGSGVGVAGDADGDRWVDLALGAPGIGAGYVAVVSTKKGREIFRLQGERTGDGFGRTTSGIADVDGDGLDDILVGAPGWDGPAGTNQGRAYLYSSLDQHLIRTWEGEAAGDQFGSAVNPVGDLDGDGIQELVVGAMDAGGGPGRAYVYSAADGALVYPLTPDPGAVDFGFYFAGSPGDMDADGTPDIYVADFNHASATGRAYVFSGRTGKRLHTFTGAGPGSGFGIGGRGLGDIDRDGFGDILLASWISDAGATDAGMVELFSGRDGGRLRRITSTTAGESLGFDAHGATGDVDGDGYEDLFLSAAWNPALGGQTGRVYMVAGEAHQASICSEVVRIRKRKCKRSGTVLLVVDSDLAKGELAAARIGEAVVPDAANARGLLKFKLAGQAGDLAVSVAGCPETESRLTCR